MFHKFTLQILADKSGGEKTSILYFLFHIWDTQYYEALFFLNRPWTDFVFFVLFKPKAIGKRKNISFFKKESKTNMQTKQEQQQQQQRKKWYKVGFQHRTFD